MNTINMPGFTAENSLYISSTQYNMTAKFLAAKADIRPQEIDCAYIREQVYKRWKRMGEAVPKEDWDAFNKANSYINFALSFWEEGKC